MLTFSEFKNILQLIASGDEECRILAKELLRPHVYDILDDVVFLTKDFQSNINVKDDSHDQMYHDQLKNVEITNREFEQGIKLLQSPDKEIQQAVNSDVLYILYTR